MYLPRPARRQRNQPRSGDAESRYLRAQGQDQLNSARPFVPSHSRPPPPPSTASLFSVADSSLGYDLCFPESNARLISPPLISYPRNHASSDQEPQQVWSNFRPLRRPERYKGRPLSSPKGPLETRRRPGYPEGRCEHPQPGPATRQTNS